MKHLHLIMVVVFALVALPASAETKIGFVNWEYLIENVPQIRAVKQKLERELEPRYTAIETDEARLTEVENRLQRDGAIMSESERKALEREMRSLGREINRDKEDLADELAYRVTVEHQNFDEEIRDVAQQFAREQGYDLIFYGPILFGADHIDLTEPLLERLRREFTDTDPAPGSSNQP